MAMAWRSSEMKILTVALEWEGMEIDTCSNILTHLTDLSNHERPLKAFSRFIPLHCTCFQSCTEDALVLDRPAPLRRLTHFGAEYKYTYLLTYLLM